MTSRLPIALLAAVMAAPLVAQDDTIHLITGTATTGVKVTSWDVRYLKFTKGNSPDQVSTDQVARLELGKFKDVYARGLRDPDLMLTVAKEKLADKDLVMAQLGFVGAAAQFFDAEKPQEAVSALDDLVKAIPEAGVLPEVYRQKFEYYMGVGPKGAQSAIAVAKKYANDALGGAWPTGLGIEAEFFTALAERKDPKDFQNKLRTVAGKAGGNYPIIANRANVELAHSLRETKDVDGAQRIYEDVMKKEGADSSSRAGAYLGYGKIVMDKASAGDKDAFKKAMLLFLRVRLETKDAWPSLHAEALYHAMLAANKWQGPEFGLVIGRCRRLLNDEFSSSEWNDKAKRL